MVLIYPSGKQAMWYFPFKKGHSLRSHLSSLHDLLAGICTLCQQTREGRWQDMRRAVGQLLRSLLLLYPTFLASPQSSGFLNISPTTQLSATICSLSSRDLQLCLEWLIWPNELKHSAQVCFVVGLCLIQAHSLGHYVLSQDSGSRPTIMPQEVRWSQT